MFAMTVRLVVSLAIVVGLLMLLARFGQKRFSGRSGSLVRVVHRQALSRSSAVAVVTVGTRVLVLGTTDQQVHLLTELEPEEIGSTFVPAQDAQEADDLLDAAYGDSYDDVAARYSSAVPLSQGRLSGSALSPTTWKQAFQAMSSLGGRSR